MSKELRALVDELADDLDELERITFDPDQATAVECAQQHMLEILKVLDSRGETA